VNANGEHDDAFERPHPNGAVRAGGSTRARRLRNRILVGVLVLAGLAWAYAIWFSVTRSSPEELDSDARAEVEDACSEARRALVALPNVDADSTVDERVNRITQENETFAAMTSRFGDVRPDGEDAAVALEKWSDDWRELVATRDAYASDLADDGEASPLEKPNAGRGDLEPITVRMNEYAENQDLEVCSPESLLIEVVEGRRVYSET
jgi:hypothetical protein